MELAAAAHRKPLAAPLVERHAQADIHLQLFLEPLPQLPARNELALAACER